MILSASKAQPDGILVSHEGKPLNFANLFRGAHAFAILSGPSLRGMNLESLNRRGILTIGVNNSPAVFRPNIWTHTDPTHKFCDAIWKDAPILKFSPAREWDASMMDARPIPPEDPKRRKKWHAKGIRTRAADGVLEFIPDKRAAHFPGVIGYSRNSTFCPETFLWEPSFNRGNDKSHGPKIPGDPKAGKHENGWPHCINTMFTCLRLAFYLGIRTLYLLGCDFKMDAAQPYAFDQGKGDPGIRGNNNAYGNMSVMLDGLRPRFEAAGFNVLNCTPNSGLWVFDHIDYREAVAEATEGIEQVVNTADWYNPIV